MVISREWSLIRLTSASRSVLAHSFVKIHVQSLVRTIDKLEKGSEERNQRDIYYRQSIPKFVLILKVDFALLSSFARPGPRPPSLPIWCPVIFQGNAIVPV